MSKIENPYPTYNEHKGSGYLHGNQFLGSATEDGKLRDDVYRLLTLPVRMVNDATMQQARTVINDLKPVVTQRLHEDFDGRYVNTLQRVTVEAEVDEAGLYIRFMSQLHGKPLHKPVEYLYQDQLVSTVPLGRILGSPEQLNPHGIWYPAAEALYVTDRIMQRSPNEA